MPVPLPRCIQQASDGIIHRTLLRSRWGSLTLFAIGNGECIEEHRTPNDEFIYVVEGRLRLEVEQEELILMQGEHYHIRPWRIHSVYAAPQAKMMLIVVRNPRKRSNP